MGRATVALCRYRDISPSRIFMAGNIVLLFMARVDLLNVEDVDDVSVVEMARNFHHNPSDGDEEDLTLPNHHRIEAHFPEAMVPMSRASHALQEHGHLPPELQTKLRIAVSMANGCRYCTGVFCTILSSEAGGEEIVKEFQRAFENGDLDGLERDVIEFAVKTTNDPRSITDEDVDYLRDEHGLTDRDLVEIIFVVNVVSSYNRMVDVFDADFEPIYHSTDWTVLE